MLPNKGSKLRLEVVKRRPLVPVVGEALVSQLHHWSDHCVGEDWPHALVDDVLHDPDRAFARVDALGAEQLEEHRAESVHVSGRAQVALFWQHGQEQQHQH